MISVRSLRKKMDYDPHTGEMTRNGKEMGTINHYGRRIILIGGWDDSVKRIVSGKLGGWRGWAAKLAWYYMTGKMPDTINVPHRLDDGWFNFRWDQMTNDKGETLEEVVAEMEKKRDGKRRVQGNGRIDRKADHRSKSNRRSTKRSAKMRGVEEGSSRGDHRSRAGDHR